MKVPVVAVLLTPAFERVEVYDEVDAEYAGSQEFMWTEGNFDCDCNKRLFIARAKGEPEPEEEHNPCGYSIVLDQLTVGGEVVYIRRRDRA